MTVNNSNHFTLEFHPLSEHTPLLTGAAFESLKADIAKHGVIEPVVLFEGKILDGRNRYRAWTEINLPNELDNATRTDLPTIDFEDKVRGNGDDQMNPADYVLSTLNRNHISSKALKIAVTELMLESGAIDKQREKARKAQQRASQKAAEEIMGSLGSRQRETAAVIAQRIEEETGEPTSEKTVRQIEKVIKDGHDKVRKALKDDLISFREAELLAEHDKADQVEKLAWLLKWRPLSNKARDALDRRQITEEQAEELCEMTSQQQNKRLKEIAKSPERYIQNTDSVDEKDSEDYAENDFEQIGVGPDDYADADPSNVGIIPVFDGDDFTDATALLDAFLAYYDSLTHGSRPPAQSYTNLVKSARKILR